MMDFELAKEAAAEIMNNPEIGGDILDILEAEVDVDDYPQLGDILDTLEEEVDVSESEQDVIGKPMVSDGEQYIDSANTKIITITDNKGNIVKEYEVIDSELKPNIRYSTDDGEGRMYVYETDDQGRIIKVTAENLELKEDRARLNHNPDVPDKKSTDDAGHLIADCFGGSEQLDNLVAQDSELNRHGDWRSMEQEWRDAIKEGSHVSVDIELKYADDSGRPSCYKVEYTIDGEVYAKTFPNERVQS